MAERALDEPLADEPGDEIAVIGMAGRFPRAADLEEFWENLRDGVEAISFYSDEELLEAGEDPARIADPRYVKAQSRLEGFELFDAAFFGLTPREAEITSPQHRLFLECSWQAFENAGYDPLSFPGAIGVFASASSDRYVFDVYAHPELRRSIGGLRINLGNEKEFLPTWLSYKLNLKGPSVNVQTACSSSLVAVHLACQSLLDGECEMALAGGVSVRNLRKSGYLYRPGDIFSPDGRCRAFDARAEGTVNGDGVGAVVLKRLDAALEDRDNVHAVIKGSAVNNDGWMKVGFTAPSVEGQTRVIAEALAISGVEADSITYVEAHGTGTRVGDPIEISALTEAFRARTPRTAFCALGSLKTSIGHLDAAAGVAGLIKTVLALEHGQLPPSLHFSEPSPQIDFAQSPFFVNAELRDWQVESGPRRAGVSAFGIGGTNAHVVLEQAPAPAPAGEDGPWQVLVLSARTRTALDAASRRLANALAEARGVDLADVAFTLQRGRHAFDHRRAVVCRDAAGAVASLSSAGPAPAPRPPEGGPRRAVFLFPGQGVQKVGMGGGLYRDESVYRGELDRCAELLLAHLGADLRQVLHPEPAEREEAGERLDRTSWTQPAVFAVEYALARQWMAWGVEPEAMIGHSIGEYVAACLAGVFRLEDALALVAARGRLMQGLPPGGMTAVPLDEEAVAPLLGAELSLAALNAPGRCVVAGPPEALAAFESRLGERGVESRRLATSHAFHSAMMEPVLGPFRDCFRGVRLSPPEIPFLSNLTGGWIREDQACDPEYWVRHLRSAVRFSAGIERLLAEGPPRALLEVGPGRTLIGLVRRHVEASSAHAVVASLERESPDEPESASLRRALGRLWTHGVEVDWEKIHGVARRRVSLPTYPFERQSFLVSSPRAAEPVVRRPETGTPEVSELPPASAPTASPLVRLAAHQLEIMRQQLELLQRARPAARRRAAAAPAEPDAAAPPSPPSPPEVGETAAEPAPSPSPLAEESPEPRDIPLTESQRALWLECQIDVDACRAYNEPMVLRLTGPLDTAALGRALQRVVARHAALRSSFSADGASCRIVPSLEVEVEEADFSEFGETARAARADAWLQRQVGEPFDLERGPLLRCGVARLGRGHHYLALVVHHLLVDGQSGNLIAQELRQFYAAERRGERLEPEAPRSYPRFVAGARNVEGGAGWTRAEAYWRALFADGIVFPELPTDRPRPRVVRYSGRRAARTIAPELAGALRRLAREQAATTFQWMLAVYGALLYRLTGQSRFVVGVPSRDPAATGPLVGYFITMLALPLPVLGEPAFAAYLGRVRKRLLDAQSNTYPLNLLVEMLNPAREGGQSLVGASFNLERGGNPPRFDGLETEALRIHPGVSRFDCHLNVIDNPHTLVLECDYRTSLFDPSTIARWLEHLTVLLGALAERPGEHLGRLPLLPPAQRHQILAEWNDTGTAPGKTGGFIELFAAQAAQTPAAVAAVCGDAAVSYGELRRRAGRGAAELRRRGVGPEVVVAVLAERGLRLLSALLAIFESGGVYLPLDPLHPAPRLARILERSRARLAFAGDGLGPVLAAARQGLGDGSGLRLARLGTLFDVDGKPPAATVSDLAYAIYTSGSTGVPKGAMVRHRGMLNHLRAKIAGLDLTGSDVVAQTASQCFDISVWQFLAVLLTGGRVEILPDEVALDPVRLLAAVPRARVTVLEPVPSMLRALLDHEEESGNPGAALRDLRYVVPTGEALAPELCRSWAAAYPRVPMVNAYGPTECSDDVTHHFLRRPPAAGLSHVPIGRPVGNTAVYVADRRLRPVAIGAAGEICVGGAGVGRGYLDEPRKTAPTFVPDPFAGPGTRLYRTGDLGRFLADGTLPFLGRGDHQVKIRGFRIELGEIEAALLEQEGVDQTVVLGREDRPGDQRLVAYVVSRSGARSDLGDLRSALRSRLPEYMVPSALVALDALPLSANGKVDRKALPAPLESELAPLPGALARNVSEELVAGIWAEVLGVAEVGRARNFFELGGHSLLATQVVSRLRRVFGVECELRLVFEAPTVAEMAARLDASRFAAPPYRVPPLRRARRVDPLPLSFAQQRLWFLDQLDPGSTAYNLPGALLIEGPLDVAAVAGALGEVVRRHESLRTVFAAGRDGPVQAVLEPRPMALPVVDLETLGRARAELEARRWTRKVDAFDLSRGPLLRATVLRLSAERWVLVFDMHHIVSDGWSTAILVRELSVLYRAFREGRPSPLPDLPLQYPDFAVWQLGWLAGDVLRAELDYWRNQLAGSPEPLRLPLDRPRPAMRTYRGATVSMTLPAELAAGAGELARRGGATLSMTLMAAFRWLLWRWTGQSEVTLGTPVAGRNRVEVEDLIGFFVNTLALRTELKGAGDFVGLLSRVRETALDAQLHQDLPFEKLVEEIEPERSLSHSPIFQVMFSLDNVPAVALDLPGLRLRPVEIGGDVAKFDLTAHFREAPGHLAGSLTYNADLFDATTIERLARGFRGVLEAVTLAPSHALVDLDPLGRAERHQQIVEWNDTAGAGQAGTIPALFEGWAGATPDAVVVVEGDAVLSFGELDRRANRLAHCLTGRGVGREDLVGIALKPSLDAVSAVVAIHKAGGAYVALGPEVPKARRAAMAKDARLSLLICRGSVFAVDGLPGVGVFDLDSARGELARASAEKPAVAVGAEQLAYVIYTSGSTGRPKGVGVEHRHVLAHLDGLLRQFGFRPGESFTLHQTLAVDAPVTQLFAALCHGGVLHLVSQDQAIDPEAWRDLFRRRRIDYLKIAPSHLATLLEAPDPGELLPRRLAQVGGEAFPRRLAEKLRRLAPEFVIVNHYGPTETTVGVVADLTRGAVGEGGSSLPIGRPLRNVAAHVVGRTGLPVPVGAAGELWVGGATVSRGYRRRGAATAERFVPDAWGRARGARLYRTGDLVRRLADGRLDFLGRVDYQVKVRGFRVELDEIEAALIRHPAVRSAVVLAFGDDAESRRLAAYVAPFEGSTAAPGELTGYLAERLPAYMVPASVTVMEAMPHSAQGKVDRRALPAPDWNAAVADRSGAAAPPSTPCEEVVAGIFRQVLGCAALGVEDDFFKLGGHSLLAIQVISRIRRAFGSEVPVKALFETPTVGGLAASLERGLRTWREEAPPPLERLPRTAAPPLSFAQERLWFLDQLDPAGSLYNVPRALRLRGRLDLGALERSLSEIVRRHETLRTTFTSIDGEPRQIVAPARPVRIPVVDLTAVGSGSRVAAVRGCLGRESWRPFDLERGPSLRVFLLRQAAEDHVALFVVHHIVSDGWSTGILVGELTALYRAFSAGRPSPLAGLPISYGDYARWQREWLSGETLRQELDFWRRELAGAPAILELPTDRPRPAVKTFRGDVRSRRLGQDLSEKLEAASREHGVTLFMTLLAGFQALLSRYSGSEDVVVGTPVSGRHHAATEDLIGLFLNTLVLRTDLSGSPALGELLDRTREVTLRAYAHQDVPFEKVVEELRPERNLSHTPLFQVLFSLERGLRREALELGSLALEPLGTDGLRQAGFDLVLLADRDLALTLEYNVDLFDAVTAERMLIHFERLLSLWPRSPELGAGRVPLLGPAQRQEIVHEWPAAGPAAPGAAVPELATQWADRAPDRRALAAPAETLTYGELERRAGRLARRLKDLGVGPEARVGIALDTSPSMVVALLAVWKAGGACVPLDPSYPAERLRWMLEDSAAAAVVTSLEIRSALPETEAAIWCLDAGAAEAREAAPVGRRRIEPLEAAYVIYTSGSTGMPKGVVAHHGGLACFARAMAARLGLGPGDRMLQFASLAFDASLVQICPTLISGAALVLHKGVRGMSTRELLDVCASSGITVLDLPAALWRQWVADTSAAREEIEAPIRRYLTGGETVPGSVLRVWAAQVGPEVGFLSSYGPTEATVTATAFVATAAEAARSAFAEVPIGRPLGGARTLMLDGELSPALPGVWAELWIGGTGVTRGYLSRPRPTAERFVPDPWSPSFGERLYHTGDLARYLGDGQMQFLGRRDHQVKIRGYRVELGEVAAAIDRYPGVRDKVVTASADEPGARRLVAYVTVEETGSFSEAELLAALREVLPEYSVPARVVVLEALPLLPNGKVDLESLPPPAAERSVSEEGFVGPRTTLELELAQLWEELLGTGPIGVRDDFFALGAHSLLAVRLIARLRARYGREVSVAELFQEPTVERLARRLSSRGVTRPWSPLVALQAKGDRPPFFCVHPIGGEVLSYYNLARRLGHDQPFYGLQAPNLADQSQEAQATIEEMASAYAQAVRGVWPRGPYLLGGVSYGGVVAFEMAQQLRRSGGDVALVAIVDAPVPLERGEEIEIDRAALVSSLVREHARRSGKVLPIKAEDLRGLELDAQLAKVLGELRKLSIVGDEVDVGLLRRFIAGYELRMRAVERYRPRPYPGAVTVFRAGEVDPEHLKQYSPEERRRFDDPAFGWGDLAEGGFEVHEVPGHHEMLTAEPHVRRLAELLASCISKVNAVVV